MRGETAARTGGSRALQRLVEREADDCVERGLPADAGRLPAQARATSRRRRDAARAAEIGERFGDADLVRARRARQGHAPRRAGCRKGSRCSTRRWSRSRAGELSPIVSGIVYCGVIEGCQEVYELRRAQEWTTALTRWCEQPARHGAVHRPVHDPPRGDHAAARRVGGRARRGAARRGDGAAQAANRAAAGEARLPTGRAPSPAGRARRGRGARIARRAGAGASRSRASRCCGWRRATPTRPPPRSGACSPRRPSRCGARGCSPPPSRSCSPRATSTRRAQRATSWRGSRRAAGATMLRRDRGTGARSGRRSRTATPAPRCVALRRAWQLWQELDAPYEAARVRVLVGAPAARSATSDARRARARRGARVFARARRGAGPRAHRAHAARARRPRPDAARARGAAPRRRRARRTRRSPRSSCSASGRSTATSATSSPSSASRRAPPPTAYAYEHRLV